MRNTGGFYYIRTPCPMKRLVASLLLALTFTAVPFAASLWTPIATKMEQSVVFLEMLDKEGKLAGSCTGFVVDAAKKHVLTAAHCDAEKVLADGTPTYELFKDERKDLMILRASHVDRPALKIARTDPDRGDEIASLGYGFGLDDPMFRVAHVSNVRMDIEGLSGPFVMIDSAFIGGQSGGPVVNDKGEVVMIVQRANDSLGLGVGATTIRDRVERYLAE
jgi:S1-C subfamily serine protease